MSRCGGHGVSGSPHFTRHSFGALHNVRRPRPRRRCRRVAGRARRNAMPCSVRPLNRHTLLHSIRLHTVRSTKLSQERRWGVCREGRQMRRRSSASEGTFDECRTRRARKRVLPRDRSNPRSWEVPKFDFSRFRLHSISPFDTLRTEPLDGLITDREPLAMRGRASNRKVRGPCSYKHEKDNSLY